MTRLLTLFLVLLLAVGASASDQLNTLDKESLSRKPVHYVSNNEEFQVTFPTGCGKIFNRSNQPDLYAGETQDDIILVEYASCDRYQEKGEGFSVTGIYNYHDRDGNMASPEVVVRRVEEALANFGAKVVEQKPVRRKFGPDRVAEGVRVAGVGHEGKGEVVVIGMLIDGDIYLLTAWKDDGDLMEDPEAQFFFDSFSPDVE